MKRRTEITILVAILVMGALVRALYLSEMVHNIAFRNPGVDAGFHDYWARGIVTDDWTPPYGMADPKIRTTPYFRPPGYPYFLAIIYAITGPSYLAVGIVQMILGLLACVLAWRFGRKWFGSAVGLVFAGFMAVYWVFVYYEGELLEPALLVPLAILLIHELSLWVERVTFRRVLLDGFCLGVFALIRPNILLFVPVVLIWAFWLMWPDRRRRDFYLTAVALLVGMGLAIFPATIRNCLVARDFVLISSNGGINLYIGNNESATGICAGRILDLGEFQTCFDYPNIVRNLERKLGRHLKHSEVSDYFSRQAVKYITENPSRALQLTWRKALLFWGPLEVGHNKEDESERQYSRVLRNIPFDFPVAFALAAVGSLLAIIDTRSQWKRHEGRARAGVFLLVALFILSYFASYLPYFVAGRYRVPVVPFLLLLGSYGLVRIADLILTRQYLRGSVFLLLIVPAYALASMNPTGFRPDYAKWHYDRAVDYESVGRTEQAIREYQRAIRIRENFIQAHTNLGLLLLEKGDIKGAMRHFSTSISIYPHDQWAHYGMGQALATMGDLRSAEDAYREAIRIDPNHFLAFYQLALVRAATGDVTSARSFLLRSLEINPRFAPAHVSLGVMAETEGKTEEAIRRYTRALEIAPDGDVHYRLGSLLAAKGQIEQAARHFHAAVRSNPRNPAAHYNLGLALQSLGDLDGAIRHFREATRIKPDYAKAHKNLAVALYMQGKYAESWKEVHLCKRYGGELHPDFLKALSARMPDPGR